jgi:hypothetical protein
MGGERIVRVVEKSLRKHGRVMVNVSISLPKTEKKQKHMRTYYQAFEHVLMRHAEKQLLPSAIRKSQSCAPADFEPFSLSAKHTVALCTDALLSLYTDVTESADGLTVHERIADTWNLGTGRPMGLNSFFPYKGFALSGYVKRQIAPAIGENTGTPPLKYLRSDDFYLLPDRIVLFWQPGVAGSSRQGVHEVSFPRV